ncbi:MAG: ParB N-terminal domain-containing protein [Candidatus Marinimicrobia bacterium]|nr:ParB N-terminal domain-containing protein [Candidatus Neomarinimicrobiota bacterium]
MDFQLKLVKTKSLLPHEEINPKHFPKLLTEIKRNKFVIPIIVDKKTFVILDGHHRFNILKTLKFKFIPVYLVDYFHKNIEVAPRREEYLVTKEKVVDRALKGSLYPYKTTKHIIKGLKKEKIPFENKVFDNTCFF